MSESIINNPQETIPADVIRLPYCKNKLQHRLHYELELREEDGTCVYYTLCSGCYPKEQVDMVYQLLVMAGVLEHYIPNETIKPIKEQPQAE